MPPADVPLNAETIIDISHESLIRNWGRLKEWVKDEADAARIYRRLADAATAYREGEGGLLDDVTLRWVLRCRDKYSPNRAWGLRYHPEYDHTIAYLEESQAAREADAAERERKRREELERERREREQAERHAADQARSARRLRTLVSALGVMFALAAVAFVAAIILEKRAEAARQSAEVATNRAETARQKLQKSRTALTLIQSYEMEQAEKELNELYRLTANDEEGHENRAWVLYNLGDLNRKLQRYDEAAAFFQSALHTEILIHGSLNLESVGTLDSIAHTFEDAGNFGAAVERFELLSQLLNSAADQKSKYFRLNTANVYKDLADLYVKRAEAAYEESVKTGAHRPSAAARDEMMKSAREKAGEQYRKALAIWEDVLRDDPGALADKYEQASDFFFLSGGDLSFAESLRDKGVRLRLNIGTPLSHKPIGPPNPGGDADINALLAPEGPGYTVFNHDTSGAYGRPELVQMIKSIAAAWAERHPDLKLIVGDMSRKGGGPFPPHGGDHQDGREVDIWPVTNNGVSEPTNIFAPNYSRALTSELINVIKQTNPNAVIYFDDPPLVTAGLTHGTLDHNNYMHILLP